MTDSAPDHARQRQRVGSSFFWGIGAAIWLLVTLVSAAQGQLFAAYQGRPQEWWPTLGYTAAVFAVWALLTPGILILADRVFALRPGLAATAAIWALGYPVVAGLHIVLFVALFWQVYGTGTASPGEMAKLVFLANLDKSVFAYLVLIAFARFRNRVRERAGILPRPNTTKADDSGLWIRTAGSKKLIPFHEIDWIAAAGDYAEIHSGERHSLSDQSLAALVKHLPEAEFARIHRGAIVRVDRIREVQGLGRGDASIILCTGETLRLSRRYRANLAAHMPL